MRNEGLRKVLIDIFGEEYEVRGGQFRINCINPDCDDTSGDLEISLEKGIFHCWECGYKGTIRKLLKDYLGWSPNINEYVSPDDLRLATENPFGEEKEVIKEVDEKGGVDILPEGFIPFNGEIPGSFIGKKAWNYVLSRMNVEKVLKYRVGYTISGDYRWRIVVPCLSGNRIIYFSAREFMGQKPKYKNPSKEEFGIGKDEVVFNIDRARELDRAVICEGVMDAIHVGDEGVAIFGTQLSDDQIFKLMTIKNHYIMFDSDAKDKAEKAAFALKEKERSPINIFIVNLNQGDPDNYSQNEIKNLLKSAKPFLQEKSLDFTKKSPKF